MTNYPDGTGPNDKSAPWNEPEVKWKTCPECEGFGFHEIVNGQDHLGNEELVEVDCEECEGSGEVAEEEV